MEGNRKKLKVLVVGAGSVGRRHIENLLSFGVEVSAFRYRSELRDELSKQYSINVFSSLEEAFNSSQDAVIIANRTDQHIPVALNAAKKGMHPFIEKPLSHNLKGINKLQEITKANNLVVEIGCMMRFHPDLKLIHQLLLEKSIGNTYFVRASVGHYLPDWRPEQDYRHSYSAKLKYGGGVLLDLIHELDYLYWLFGPVSDVSAFLDHVSDLEIETEDIAQILLRFENGIVAQVQMDYLSPFYRRTCEIIGSKGIITWDYNSGEAKLRIRGESGPRVFNRSALFERNAMFIDHMKHFLSIIQDGGKPAVSLEEGINVLKIAIAAHKSSKERIAVRPSEILM